MSCAYCTVVEDGDGALTTAWLPEDGEEGGMAMGPDDDGLWYIVRPAYPYAQFVGPIRFCPMCGRPLGGGAR